VQSLRYLATTHHLRDMLVSCSALLLLVGAVHHANAAETIARADTQEQINLERAVFISSSSTGSTNTTAALPSQSYELAIFFGSIIGVGIIGLSIIAAIKHYKGKYKNTGPLLETLTPEVELATIAINSMAQQQT